MGGGFPSKLESFTLLDQMRGLPGEVSDQEKEELEPEINFCPVVQSRNTFTAVVIYQTFPLAQTLRLVTIKDSEHIRWLSTRRRFSAYTSYKEHVISEEKSSGLKHQPGKN